MESKKAYIPEFIYKRSNQTTMIIFVPIFALLFVAAGAYILRQKLMSI